MQHNLIQFEIHKYFVALSKMHSPKHQLRYSDICDNKNIAQIAMTLAESKSNNFPSLHLCQQSSLQNNLAEFSVEISHRTKAVPLL